jgi:hypothetical protein
VSLSCALRVTRATPAKVPKNGSDAEASRNNLKTLKAAFAGRGYVFRHFPRGKVDWLRWQALRRSHTEYHVNGDTYIEGAVELVAFAPTALELADRLAAVEVES